MTVPVYPWTLAASSSVWPCPPVPIFCLSAPRGRGRGRGKASDPAAAATGAGGGGEEAVFYAAGVGVVHSLIDGRGSGRGGGGAGGGAGGKDKHILPATSSTRVCNPRHSTSMASYNVASNVCQALGGGVRPQRHFRGHADDVRCLTVHAATRTAASGEMGLEPTAMVWSVDDCGGRAWQMSSPRHRMPFNSLKRGFKVTPTSCGA